MQKKKKSVEKKPTHVNVDDDPAGRRLETAHHLVAEGEDEAAVGGLAPVAPAPHGPAETLDDGHLPGR